MSEVKRYMPVARYIGDNKYEAVMLPLDGFPAKVIEERGRFVLHSDYAALAAERDALRARVEELERRQAMLRYCATELRQLTEGNSAAAQEGL